MKKDIAFNCVREEIKKDIASNCDCGLTGGCTKCNFCWEESEEKQTPQWEKELKDLLDKWGLIPTPVRGAKSYNTKMRKAIKDFIRTLLSRQAQEIREEALAEKIKEIEGLKAFTDYPDTPESNQARHENRLFNSALDKALEILNPKRRSGI